MEQEMSNMSRDDEGEFLPARVIRPLPTTYPRPQTVTASDSETDDVAVVMHYLLVLWKRKWILLLCTALGILVGVGASLWTTPLYHARTSLEISASPDPLNPDASADLGTKVQLFSSVKLAERVKKKLSEKEPASLDYHDPLAKLRRLLGFHDPVQSITWEDAVSWAASERRVLVNGESRVLLIDSKSPHPQAAAEFTNKLAEEFIAEEDEKRLETLKNQRQLLSRAGEVYESQLKESERLMRDFSKSNGLIAAGSQNVEEQKLKDLQAARTKAEAELTEAAVKYQMSVSS